MGEIDLRLCLRHWRYGYMLDEDTASGPRQGLQIFDAHGIAVHKIFATAATDAEAFARLAEASPAPDAAPAQFFPGPAPEAKRPDAGIDREEFLTGLDALAHSHEVFCLLVRRRPCPGDAAWRSCTGATGGGVCRWAPAGRGCGGIAGHGLRRQAGLPSDPLRPGGADQTHGTVAERLDPRFNLHLHLHEDRIAAASLVRKPSPRGDIHSLELFDTNGECFCQIFGARPGWTERVHWRSL